jgi:ribosomal protein S18 acetylase RimI-like enzyme
MPVTVRPATEADLPALTRLDLTYPTDRFLSLERSGEPPELKYALRWRNRVPAPMAVYATYTVDRLRDALMRTNLFLVAEVDGEAAGFLMIIVPEWTDAAEMTDLAVDIAFRRMGAGRALIDAAAEWARERGLRALWVEPRADNQAAISFYISMGFRLSGFNDRLYSNADDADGKPTISMHLELHW